ncbi:MAG: hypothetical protein JW843_09080 [Candidatus Aminicenantes bacterium]|nr:hypothetical protein [Candidatus Aminicenantes bacterium]
MKIKIAALCFCLAGLAGCMSYEGQQVKLLREGLQPMLGRSETDVLDLIVKNWQYGVLDQWKAENPDVAHVLRNNYRTFGFSRKEAEILFAEPGSYRVMIFTRPLRTEELTTGSIDSLGGGVIGTSERNVSVTHGYIRLVIHNGILAHYWAGT